MALCSLELGCNLSPPHSNSIFLSTLFFKTCIGEEVLSTPAAWRRTWIKLHKSWNVWQRGFLPTRKTTKDMILQPMNRHDHFTLGTWNIITADTNVALLCWTSYVTQWCSQIICPWLRFCLPKKAWKCPGPIPVLTGNRPFLSRKQMLLSGKSKASSYEQVNAVLFIPLHKY